MASRRDFLSQAAPENYVAGLGRGATGFTTRSDLGPAREGPTAEQIQEALAKRAQQLGAAPPTAYGAAGKKPEEREEDDERFQDPDNETGLFAFGHYDRDDDEADRIYQEVEEKMERRRKAQRLVHSRFPVPAPPRSVKEACGLSFPLWDEQITDVNPSRSSREAREREEIDDYNRKNPNISEQFADLKRPLATITDDEWANLPDPGDLTGKNRRSKQNLRQRFYAVPDSVLAGARDSTELQTTVQDEGADPAVSADNRDGTMTNFAAIGVARDKVLKARLDRAAQSDAGTGSATAIDTKGYLTSLNTAEFKASELAVGDVKRVRVLLESVIKTNPKHAPGWIAIARLDELAGKIVSARKLIAQGCEQCPKSEDAWLENIRMNDNHNAKIVAANAIKNNERSTRLWIEAMKLESEPRAKKRVLRQAIDHIPQSVAIWKEAVNLEEDPEDAKLLLAKATEIIPLSVELWLALARLESPENAQAVLNKARKAVPTSHEIWIAAARLQEQIGNAAKVNIMNRAVKALVKEGAMLKREEWIAEAEKCEEEGAVLTCGAIIRETLGYGLDEDDDRKEIFKDDAKASMSRERYETARAIYAYALRIFPTSTSLWLEAADLERHHGTKEALWQVLEKAVEACPQSETFWLQLAREKWYAGNVDDARRVLGRAFNQNPKSEEIWLAAVKLEADAKQVDQARDLLATARQEAATERVWYKSAAYERQLGNIDVALDLVLQGLTSTVVEKKETRFPRSAKLWMIKGQIYEDKSMIPQAREAYSQGTRLCPKSVPLWLLASRLEEKAGIIIKARSVLDRARLQNPKNPELWVESIRVELHAKPPNVQQAKILMSKAIQECPKSGLLLSENIWRLQPRTQRKPLALEAIKAVDNDPILFVTIARIFWSERRLDKAMSWFEKAIVLDPDLGDTWAWYLKFLMQHGTDDKREDVISKCVSSEPKHGEVWQRVRKDPKNAYLSTKEVLMEVMKQLETKDVIA
ncbi:U4/U6 x U5 tri-snRNP complex subunit Prp1 [Exophiala xenobiotica]|uniref:U4/U6 x U5 tri-snRNP complex subunit Prp1 n=1 Tax=Vermiconidia calcicola TaxID=1690605 RepID=A0AAV9QCD6_9PEZI|nr:U4/U6 x U5 tri-snRNP complex subunit Prp1 [Exophiala xenobiotica]KAK5528776.1 U4/U6 x U5 tri-snRNP complex subunit Prp1 [Chaetothyriales sp. CCFEE 6169]KAK5537753.1 U4/U6 x U5 tri-snRNP complex subunit Prp1 [Vermiconidia calcicola]KAK5219036.1 U4/U6 x U5 tri-snRNP complex subunit Prp1 [Exophiala xenobiotica]KAK5235339.1 U4/U6 x U5 tri-snRNP complex subunit Prp1 [Exophiala xenobiotica]